MSPATPARESIPDGAVDHRRIAALDGIRAIAALIVLFHHAILVSPSIVRSEEGGVMQVTGTLGRLLSSTPLIALRASREAVIVFFVLSGYVLALPHVRKRAAGWAEYYGRRLTRLYLPVWGALVLAAVLLGVVGTDTPSDASWWVARRAEVIGAGRWLDDVFLLGHPGQIVSPLWTLQWEVAFSVLLPLYIVVTRRWVRWWPVLAVVLAALIVVGPGQASHFLPMFGAGVLLAYTQDRWQPWLAALLIRRPWWTIVFLAGAALAIGGRYLVLRSWSSLPHGGLEADRVASVLPVIGSALLIAVTLCSARTASVLAWHPLHWLGIRSFSLYLVHEPIVLAFGLTLGWSAAEMLLAITVSIAAAAAFYVVVERPSITVSRRIGAWAAAIGHHADKASTTGSVRR